MKSILIAINVMLAILAAGEVIKCLTMKEDVLTARESTTVKKGKETSKPLATASVKSSPLPATAIQRSPAQMDEQVNVIAALNIFSPDRTPEIPTIAKRMTANNTRAEMKLVGTFEIDGTKGAIILQRNNQRNGNRNGFGFDGGFGMGGFGFGGMGFGIDQNTANQNNNTAQASAEEVSQAQIEDARQRLTQLQSVLQTLQRNGASADQLASITRQIEAQNTLLQQLLAIATPETSEDGVASISATNTNNIRQYLRLGDSTADGYMLIDVTRTTATLRRNNEVIELTIQKASENQEAMALAASRASAAQVVVSDTPANTSSSPAPSNNNRGRRNNGGFGGDFGGFGGGDFGGFGGGDFGGGDFGNFGGGEGGFGGFGGGNDRGGFGGGNNGLGGGNGGFGGRNNNSGTRTMTEGNRAGMNSNSRTTTNSASSRNIGNRTGMNSNTAGRTNNATRTNTGSRTNSNANTTRNNMNTGRTNSNTSRNNAAGRTGVNTGNRTGGAGMGGR